MAIASATTIPKSQHSCKSWKSIRKAKRNRLDLVLTYNDSRGTVNGNCDRIAKVEGPVAVMAEDLNNEDALRDRPMKHRHYR